MIFAVTKGQPATGGLHPVENIWQFMRDNWLSNRIFETYDEIVDHFCDAWNKLIGQLACSTR